MTRLLALVHCPALLGALALLALGGCARHPGAVREVRFWAMGREGEVVRQLMPAFEREHPGIRVAVQQIPWSAAHEKLLTAFVGGAMPDVFQLGSTWVAEFAAIGAAAPVDDRLGAGMPADDYFAGVLEGNRSDGALYAVPWYVDTRLLFYRRDLLAAAGFDPPLPDWQAWRTAMERVQSLLAPGSHAILLPVREWQPLIVLALQCGATLLRDGDRYGAFQSPEFRRAFEFYLNIFRDRLAPVDAGQISNIYQDFAAGFFAFYITGPWNLGEFAARLPARMRDSWSTMPMPPPRAGEPGVSVAGGASLALSATARDPDAAWQLIEYLSRPAVQLELYRLAGDLPARRSAWRDPLLADDPRAAAFWVQLQHVRPVPAVPEWERIARRVTDYADAAVRGTLTPEAALAALDREVDALLAKRRWMLERRAAEGGA